VSSTTIEPDIADDHEGHDDDEIVLAWWHNPINLVAIFIAIAVLAGGVGWLIGNNSALPDPNSTDVGFLQDMRTHHEQAVTMGLAYLQLEGTDPALRVIAREIVVGQSLENGLMVGMLREFGKPEANETDTAMSWMGQPTPLDSMPGMATESDLDALSASSGRAADEIFVKLMIAHHQGGIHMAEYAADHAGVGSVRDLARLMADGQAEEITELQGLIATSA
jgi:uncharacterized protein (DUF305 family)